MKSKHPLKSKTLLFLIATGLLMLFGPSEKPIAEMTWRELGERQGGTTTQIVDILKILGLGGAAYGRVVAKDKIGGKDDA